MGIKRDFTDEHVGKVGRVEDGDGSPIEVTAVTLSVFCPAETAAAFGCPAGQFAILAEYVPADLVPSERVWVTFPKAYSGTPVYYKCRTANAAV